MAGLLYRELVLNKKNLLSIAIGKIVTSIIMFLPMIFKDGNLGIKCGRDDYREIAAEDIVSARLTDFGAEVTVSDKAACKRKYSGLVMDNTTLAETMVFCVNREKKEWR